MTEKELIADAKSGNKDAFATLYGRYEKRLYRYAYYRLNNTSDAHDAVADTVVCAYEEIGAVRKPETFAKWIFSILRARCGKYIKQQINQREALDYDELYDSAELSASDNNSSIELKEALSMLTDEEREIVLLSVVAGFTSREIAQITDMTAGAVRSKLSRSLSKMRAFLE